LSEAASSSCFQYLVILVAFDNIKTYADLKEWFRNHYTYFDVSYCEADLF